MRRAAAPLPDRTRQATSKARASAPSVRISHSRRRASSCSVDPRHDLRQQGSERAGPPRRTRPRCVRSRLAPSSRDRPPASPRPAPARRSVPPPRVASTWPATRNPPPCRPAVPRAQAQSSGQRSGEIAVGALDAGVRGLPLGLDRVARVGEDDHRVAAHEALARVASDLLLPIAQREPGEVPHVLATDTEVGVDAGVGEAAAQSLQASRPGGSVRFVPPGQVRRRRARAEVARLRPPWAASHRRPARRHQL